MDGNEDEDGAGMAVIEGYEPLKAAQVAALLLERAGGSMDKLKLVKLLYLCERESIRLHRHPMFGDQSFSLKHGPAGTNALNGIDGNVHAQFWGGYVRLEGNEARRLPDLDEEDFDELSSNDVDIVDDVSLRFAGFTASQMRAWTHDPRNLPEYESVGEGRREITDEALARALGFADPERWARGNAGQRRVPRGRG